jgi:hypothetical protein
MSVPVAPARAVPVTARRAFPLFAAGALGLLCGELLIFFGTAWDIQWHVDVGPDTFFTAPHLLIYSGVVLDGITCLAVVLASTYRARQPDIPSDPAALPILRRTFWAPVGFVLGGTGAALWLVFGSFDQWWHRVYGFDVGLDSPPHVGLSLADITAVLGCVTVFALLVTRSRQASVWRTWPAIGLATAGVILLSNSIAFETFSWMPSTIMGVLDGPLTLTAAFYGLVMMMVVSIVRRPGTAALTGLVFTLLSAASWVVSVGATRAYAVSIGLALRDDAVGFPILTLVLPKFLLVAGVLIDLVLGLARRRNLGVRTGVALAAGAGMLALVGLEAPVLAGAGIARVTAPVATTIAAAAVGAVAGWAGWKFGVVIRRVATGPAAIREEP